jgi:signal transduction histidine kinase
MNRIANAADKMQALLSDLLELSRVGLIINTPENVPFDQIITIRLLA